ncbi:DUF4164 family protein [Stappia sp. GBMRC 2046]|uniref:DUF4164 family protein n=2 Tax=Stappia sediminis TaxID=2692190 RepID=A0A7X3S842_9HYPH|nr:DUF4164 domain-containing protein [Stappia sediminis]MXN65384.1 DUF4164 family protein [Stappia sediminis]
MSENPDATPAVDASLQRLSQAISKLESAVERRLDADTSLGSLQDELQRLGEDRSQLAETLDKAEARATRLEEANREVSRRLVSAMESIRTVLEAHGG